MKSSRQFAARYCGKCACCGETFSAGAAVVYVKNRLQLAVHAEARSHSPVREKSRTVFDYPPDRERARDDYQYAVGASEAGRYMSDRRIYGDILAEQWEMEAEAARYNRGEDDY